MATMETIKTEEYKDISTFCRLCAELKDPLELKTTINDQYIEHKLIYCCQWNSQKNDDFLPQNICNLCIEKLEQSWTFAESVARAQIKIREKFSGANSNSSRYENERNGISDMCFGNVFDETLVSVKLETPDLPLHTIFCNEFNEASTTSKSLKRKKKKKFFKYECEQCRQRFSSKSCLNRHISLGDHTKESPFICYLCKRGFQQLPSLKDHMLFHTTFPQFKCKYCNLRYRTKRKYYQHEKKHVEYICDFCGKKFPSAYTLRVHKRGHIGASQTLYGCVECDHVFTNMSAYYSHMQRKHGMDHATAKRAAKRIAPNGTASKYVCDECGRGFRDSTLLRAHKATHSDERPFKCSLCDKAFKTEGNLKVHQRTHTGEKPEQCSECGKRFSRSSILKKHMENHTGVIMKPFACEFCDKAFRTLFNLTNHRRIHTGEKPYCCEPCNVGFSTLSILNRHKLTQSHLTKAASMVSTAVAMQD